MSDSPVNLSGLMGRTARTNVLCQLQNTNEAKQWQAFILFKKKSAFQQRLNNYWMLTESSIDSLVGALSLAFI